MKNADTNEPDPVNHPPHYATHASGVECADITEHLSSNLGNVVKYTWRKGLKDPAKVVQDLQKAHWYVVREREVTIVLLPSHEIIQPGAEGVIRVLSRMVIEKEPEDSLLAGVLREIVETTDGGWENNVASVESALLQIGRLIHQEIERLTGERT